MLGSKSNEAMFRGKRTVIKCAAMNTSSVGVSYLMLERIHSVIGAFKQPDGSYNLILLPVATFVAHQRPTRSKGPSNGRVGLVSRAIFETKGTELETVHV